jgi:capsular exopolysaccharide synthesis family protein
MHVERGQWWLPERTSARALGRVTEAYVPMAPMAAPAPEPAAPNDWQRYVVAVRRHSWLVLIVTLLGTALGVVATRLLDPAYTAKAILWIEGAGREARADADGFTGDPVVETASWVELVTSNAVLDSVVRGLRLYVEPASRVDSTVFAGFDFRSGARPGRYRLTVASDGKTFALRSEDDVVLQRGTVGDSIGAAVGFAWAPTAEALQSHREIEFAVMAPYDAAQQLARSLRVGLDPGGSFLRVELRGTDPSRTAATVNGVVDRVVAVAADLKREKFEELVKILGDQYNHARTALFSADTALTEFQVRNAARLQPPAAGDPRTAMTAADPALAASIQFRLTLEQLGQDRAAIRDILSDAAANPARLDALSAIGAVRESPPLSLALTELTKTQAELRALGYRYTSESAPVQQARARLDTLERRTIPALARQLVADLGARERMIVPRADSSLGVLRTSPRLALEQARLTRHVQNAEELSTTVGQQYESARLALLSSLPALRVVDRAVTSQRPVSNFAPLLVVLSFGTSLAVAVVGVTIRDRIDPKVRYPEQVTREMRLPILAAVPHVGWRATPGFGDPSGEAIEALRSLRIRVLHAHGAEGPLLLTVTSPAVGEGKSFVSANLSLSFAYAGYRTLLIDGDIRRGAQHRVFAAAHRPGLTDILAGQTEVDAAIQSTEYTGLSFLSAGTPMESAPELLLSSSLRELFTRLRTEYSIVIVDSPPLAAGVDPLVLGTATGNLLLVLRSGATDMPLAMAKLDVADSLPVRTIGAVLNDVRRRGAFRYHTYDLSGYGQIDGVPVGGTRASWRKVLTGRST